MKSFTVIYFATLLMATAISTIKAFPASASIEDTPIGKANKIYSLNEEEKRQFRVQQMRKTLYNHRRSSSPSSSSSSEDEIESEKETEEMYKGTPYPDGVEPSAGCKKCQSSLQFAEPAAKKYEVGTEIPTLPFKTKNFWAGNIPIKGSSVENATLYFWLWGKDSIGHNSGDDLVIWLNGGPGCSSLSGALQENGPFLYLNKNQKPFPNGYSWTRAANMLWVEQPVHTGFTTGISHNTNEEEVAEQFESFLLNFYNIFPELRFKRLWITGESYAGTYIPYIETRLYKSGRFPQLHGGIIIDGSITDQRLQEDVVISQYVIEHQKTLNFTNQDVNEVIQEADKCDLTDFVELNLHYPPKNKERLPSYSNSCQPFETFFKLANERNPNFYIYDIDLPNPDKVSPLGAPNSGPQQYLHETFFDNKELQTYINAPHHKWVDCAIVFVGDKDLSKKPDREPNFENNILAFIIEKSKNFLILNGDLDALLITNGTALALQNLSWNGDQGFSKAPLTPLYDINGEKAGTFTHERGLTFAEIPKSGHMLPGQAPATGLAALLQLIGKRDWTKGSTFN